MTNRRDPHELIYSKHPKHPQFTLIAELCTKMPGHELLGMSQEQADELHRLIQQINAPYLKRKKEREAYQRYLDSLEHGPDLDPAA